MLGAVFALIAAVTFAWTNAAVRRGVVTGTAVQATTLSIPIGVPIFFAALLISGEPARLWELPVRSSWYSSSSGLITSLSAATATTARSRRSGPIWPARCCSSA